MRARTVTVVSVCAILIGAVTIGLYAQNRSAKQPPTPVPRPIRQKVKKQEGLPQPTRIQIDLFDLTCTTDQLVELDADQIGADGASSAAVIERLGKFGDVKHVIRVDNVVDLADESQITQGVRVPVVRDVTVSKSGTVTPSVSYEEIGFISEIKGQWREDVTDSRADIACSIEISGIKESGVQVASGINLSTYNQIEIEQQMSLADGVPVLIFSNDMPIKKENKLVTHVTVVRMVLTKLPD
ncbi:MAG: hypothetical protein ACYTF1_20495 [Planctomycetota bacterium]|jgi:hypothetical protein